jgi:metallophosphoesterase superfamily enzyme
MTCSEEDIVRVMVSTDNHLGFEERNAARAGDSFAAFEEVLTVAREKKVDLVLLAGDLFHENKPSRYTLFRFVAICSSYFWLFITKYATFGSQDHGNPAEICTRLQSS